ncbi:hypothetical protein B2G71_02715 [Novosphingobium sp. PC22D]|nr:hypothetical protein B2G71_02715 [Novosphingobium sp. PC22D]
MLVVLALLLFAAMVARGGLVPTGAEPPAAEAPGPSAIGDADLDLYARASERIAAGENYYDFIVAEQRARDYPVRPGLTVRLPTLAWLRALLGEPGMIAAGFALVAAVVAAWWRRFGEEGVSPRQRRIATALVFVGCSLALNPHYLTMHELWAGCLIALAFGLHRVGARGEGGRWVAALCAGAVALAIREHALPFVLLMAAVAAWQRNWREAAAWSALVAVFLSGLVWHLALVAGHVLPSDPSSASWLALRGLAGWLGNVVEASNLHVLPRFVSGPLVILMAFGWLGWRSRGGPVLALFALGYGLAFAIAGRADNFYWGAVVAPSMFAGLAFAPAGFARLLAAAELRAGGRLGRQTDCA